MKLKLLLTTAILASSVSFAALAADEHGHQPAGTVIADDHNHVGHTNEEAHKDEHKHEDHADAKSHGDEQGHTDEASHFSIAKPENAESAASLLDQSLLDAKKALEGNDTNGLHEAGEKLEVASGALAEFSKGNDKLTQALAQLSKTVDRFHHAAEDKDIAGAKESLQILEGQTQVVKMLSSPAGQ